ncbi:MAG: hypothetical protein M1820_000333 [Bogoriella megaspora]|nr:MAG: hypothetical protein M1820_000333 [Bogoriella megaspora]
MAASMKESAHKRKPDAEAGGPPTKMSKAEEMMAKMGYKKGTGLGKGGEGMVNPIEVKLRPQGAGLGAVKEKTKQAKEEEKREAKRSGRKLEDSSDEERAVRVRRNQVKRSGVSSDSSTPVSEPRTRYQLLEQSEANMLDLLIDATGQKYKVTSSMTEGEKGLRRAQRHLNNFDKDMIRSRDEKIHNDRRRHEIQEDIAAREKNLQDIEELIRTVEQLEQLTLNKQNDWAELVEQLTNIQAEHPESVWSDLQEAAVASMEPIFTKYIHAWDPLKDDKDPNDTRDPGDPSDPKNPNYLVEDLERLRQILNIDGEPYPTADDHDRKRHSSPYESMIQTIWLPKMRRIVARYRIEEDTETLLAIVHAWKPVLPPSAFYILVEESILRRLSDALHKWSPRSSKKRNLPHVWLFGWFQYLDSRHSEPKGTNGLLAEVKTKLKTALNRWDLGEGLMPGIDKWSQLLRQEMDHLLMNNLLPRLSSYLSANFTVNPADQDDEPLKKVLEWHTVLKPSILGELLVSEVFPKWLDVLYQWLSSPGARFDEIATWYEWWNQQFPEEINSLPRVVSKWQEGLDLINAAVDLWESGLPMEDLPPPAAGPSRPIQQEERRISEAQARRDAESKARRELQNASFKDVVEEWCADQGLMLIDTKQAHSDTGNTLYRITTGKGGVLVYLKGDVVWAKDKERGDWQPVGIEPDGEPQPLLQLAGLR